MVKNNEMSKVEDGFTLLLCSLAYLSLCLFVINQCTDCLDIDMSYL